jgi:hypothetical protein
MLHYIYIYIYIYTTTHTHRQSNNSIYHARPFVCSYGEMFSTNTEENFAAQVQVHVTLYIYIYIYIHIHTHIEIYTHTLTETGHQVHQQRTALCLQLRRNNCNYYARESCCTCAPTAARPCNILYIYAYTHIYIYTHTHNRDKPASTSNTHGPLYAVTAKLLQQPRKRNSLQLCAHSGKSMLFLIYIYIHIHTHIYIYTITHIQRQASKSIYHVRPLVCIYGDMIATTTHEIFAALARP